MGFIESAGPTEFEYAPKPHRHRFQRGFVLPVSEDRIDQNAIPQPAVAYEQAVGLHFFKERHEDSRACDDDIRAGWIESRYVFSLRQRQPAQQGYCFTQITDLNAIV